jgi:NodT family efflux transporter outer membrane factor (OMF) lipoprotein
VAPAGANFVRAPHDTAPQPPVARWWEQLNDQELNALIERAINASPNVEIALARIRQARAVLTEEHAKELPTTGASAAYLRAHNLTSALGAESTNGSSNSSIYALGFDATWEVDLFGAQRRAAEGAAASLEGARANLRDVMVTLTADTAQAYIELRDAQQREALTRRNIEIEQQTLDLMERRRTGGTASDLDVSRVSGQLQSVQASAAPIRAQILEQEDRLALLTGGPPGSLDTELQAQGAVPLPPATVNVGDPGGLLRRRPDIAIAERNLAQQTATIGQNVAALFPKLNLLGEIGFTAPSPGTLFNGSSFTYIAAPVLQWAPWDFGRTFARIGQARAGHDEAEAEYRRTVLGALQDAETALSRYGEQRNTVTDLAHVRDSAERSYALTEVRLRAGAASTSDVLASDSQRVQAQLDYQQSLAQLTEDFVAIQKSLGLGWVNPHS